MADVVYISQENWTDSTQNSSQSITIPSDAEAIFVVASGWNGSSAYNLDELGFTDGVDEFTQIERTYYNNNNQTTCCGYYMNSSDANWPGTGTKTLYYYLNGTVQGYCFIAFYVKAIDTTTTIGATNFEPRVTPASSFTFASMTIGSEDMMVIGAHDVDLTLDVEAGTQTLIAETTTFRTARAAAAYEINQDQIAAAGHTDGSYIAFVVKAAAAGGGGGGYTSALTLMGVG